ncbi:MAG TPA: hypothetical protein VFG68_03610 [Fimbriiglobus sp.]|nr:hypothetical protein [Fimbriiglobus sp.]
MGRSFLLAGMFLMAVLSGRAASDEPPPPPPPPGGGANATASTKIVVAAINPTPGMVKVESAWADCTGAAKVTVWLYYVTVVNNKEVLNLISSSDTTGVNASGSTSSTHTGLTKGKTVRSYIDVYDIAGNLIKGAKSADGTVP